jgi:hypothetical protein
MFFSVYVDCVDDGKDFMKPTNRVRDTLEQIDVAKLIMDKYSDTFEYCESAVQIRDAIYSGKVAGLLGVEGSVRCTSFTRWNYIKPCVLSQSPSAWKLARRYVCRLDLVLKPWVY